jgi:hypothetical protein
MVGKSTVPFNDLKEKPQQFASAIYGSRMRRQDAYLAYKCYYITSIGYALAATKIRNVAPKIACGPKTLVGLEMHDLYTIQGTKWLQYFLGHIMCNDGNGNLVRICMESTQLEVGLYEPFLFLN